MKIVVITTLITIAWVIIVAQAQITELESKNRDNLVKSLSSPKITRKLRSIFLESNNKNIEKKNANIIIEFKSGNSKALKEFKEASNSGIIKATATRGERINSLVERLEDNAALSQKGILNLLQTQKLEFRALWVSNEIYVKGADANLIGEIADKFESVAKVRPVGIVAIPKPVEELRTPSIPDLELLHSNINGVPWNINQVKARCKDIKCLGEGVVIAIVDTGVLWNHTELIDNYRHDFGFFDPVNGTELPSFSSPHGTHVTGIAVGKTKGVAPKAKWIACKAFRTYYDEEVYLKACGEFVLCPHRWNDTKDRDCSKAPDIINNSWNANHREQLTLPSDFYYGIISAWNAAGIISLFSAGNDGPYCTTVNPPAAYDVAFSVGATGNDSNIAMWSSRGPVINKAKTGFKSGRPWNWQPPPGLPEDIDTACVHNCVSSEGGRTTVCTQTKPEISAPGVKINSSHSDNTTFYKPLSGTSMSGPMVAGVLALVLCANNQTPGNRRLDVATAQNILTSTADRIRINLEEGNDIEETVNFARDSHLLCNIAYGNKCGAYPNNVYGAGQIDACAAVKKVKSGKF